ncbi:MAG TPA: host attachment protein [Burkholderiales bacterium]|nr:host attachment protein [Burkholderiales bacterium]
MVKKWIVVADSSRARVFEMANKEKHLREVEDMVNPEGRANHRDLESDAAGHYYGRADRMQGPSAGTTVNAVEHEVEWFAKSVSQYLDKGRTERRYDRLYLVAAPKFLGLLRENLTKETRNTVSEELSKEVSWLDERDVESYIRDKIAL